MYVCCFAEPCLPGEVHPGGPVRRQDPSIGHRQRRLQCGGARRQPPEDPGDLPRTQRVAPRQRTQPRSTHPGHGPQSGRHEGLHFDISFVKIGHGTKGTYHLEIIWGGFFNWRPTF